MSQVTRIRESLKDFRCRLGLHSRKMLLVDSEEDGQSGGWTVRFREGGVWIVQKGIS